MLNTCIDMSPFQHECSTCIILIMWLSSPGYVNGTDVVHLLHRHGAEDCLSVATRNCDKNVTAERTTLLVTEIVYMYIFTACVYMANFIQCTCIYMYMSMILYVHVYMCPPRTTCVSLCICREVCYQCPLKAPLRALWRVELFKMKSVQA